MRLAKPNDRNRRGHAAIAAASKKDEAVTNRIAIFLGVMIIGFLVADGILFGWQMSLFLGRKFTILTEYIKFWR